MHRLAVAFVGLSAVALGGIGAQAQAQAATLSRTSVAATTISRSAAAARASAPIRAGTISSELLRATGHSASQLTTRAACGSAAEGRIRCYARVLTVKSTGKPASLLRVPQAASATVTHASSAAVAPQEYTADFLQSAYDTTWLSANDGDSDTVAIVDAYGDSTAYSDMEQFRTANGLQQIPTCANSSSPSCFEVVNQTGQTQTVDLPTNSKDETGSWNIEESLDIDAVSSLCPLCKILVVEAKSDDDRGRPDLETAVSEASTLGANQISLSWGADVSPDWSNYSSPYSSITSSAILAAAGDDTYPGPDVGYPAALPDVTAVGGTSVAANSTSARGFGESAWSVESCSGGTPCATESGCDTSQSVPQFQDGVTTDCDGRAYNDISADADPETGLEIYDSQSGDEGCGNSSNMCIIGGTSLATPLTAALEAVTGISTETPIWTYRDASLLNDIVSGSDGSCPSGWFLICNAAIGWDGPTGNGSISGDLASGGPGLGGASDSGANATDVTLTGGLYPNGESTTYDWQYWPSSQSASSATPTPTATAGGSTLQSVSTSLCHALTPSTTYDYDLVATNTSGSETGYQGSFTTPATESAPTASSAPAISGSDDDGQTLSGIDAAWNDASCNSAPSYAWQESSSSGGPWTTVSTGQTYGLTSADDGEYLRFEATESNGTGSTTASSAVIGPVTEPGAATATTTTASITPTTTTQTTGPTTTASPPTTTTTTTTTTTPDPSGGAATTTTTVRFYRCARTCMLINTHDAKTYRPVKADYGRYIKVVTTVARIAGNVETDTTSTRWVGPVTSATAGDISLGSGARVASATIVRGSTGKQLAQVRVARRVAGKLTLVVRRETTAATQVWAFVVSGGQVVSSTAVRSLSRPATLSFALKRGQTIRLVAVRT
jgi:hypothetical protein